MRIKASIVASILFSTFLVAPVNSAGPISSPGQSANRNSSNNGIACQQTQSTKAQSGNSRASTCVYTVTWNANGGSLSGSSTTSWTFGTPLSFTSSPIRSGYSFTGWYINPSGGTRVDSGTYIPKLTSNFTLYAQWSANIYTVTWDANGGSLSGSSTSSWIYGTQLTLPSAPTKTNYEFTGWFTESNGGIKVGDAGSSYIPTNLSSFTIYAQWIQTITPASFTIQEYSNSFNYFSNIPSGVSFDICEKDTSNCIQITENTREGDILNLILNSPNSLLEATYHNSRADASASTYFVWLTKGGVSTFIPRADIGTYFTASGQKADSNNTFSNGDVINLRILSNPLFSNLTSGTILTPPVFGTSAGTIQTYEGYFQPGIGVIKYVYNVQSYQFKSCNYEGLEDSVYAFDGQVESDPYTKYCNSGVAKGINNLPDEIILSYQNGTSVRVTALDMSTANDATGRDPVAWTLSGSNDGLNWTEIATHSYPYNNATALARFSKYPLVEFTNTNYFSYLKFAVTNVINPGLGVVQYSGLRLFGDFSSNNP